MTKEETINYDLFNKFNNNHIVDSIIGKGEFFIADYTYRSHHDSLLVLNQLSIWAKRNNKTHELLNYIKKSTSLTDGRRYWIARVPSNNR